MASAALWRYAGALGKIWRLAPQGVPDSVRDKHADLLCSLRAELLPHQPGGSQQHDLLGILSALAGGSSLDSSETVPVAATPITKARSSRFDGSSTPVKSQVRPSRSSASSHHVDSKIERLPLSCSRMQSSAVTPLQVVYGPGVYPPSEEPCIALHDDSPHSEALESPLWIALPAAHTNDCASSIAWSQNSVLVHISLRTQHLVCHIICVQWQAKVYSLTLFLKVNELEGAKLPLENLRACFYSLFPRQVPAVVVIDAEVFCGSSHRWEIR